MNKSVFLPRNLFFIFLGCNIFYSGQNVSGIGVPIRNDSGSKVIASQLTSSASYRRSIDIPFVTVGAVITAHDFNTEMSKALRSYAPGSDRYHGGSEKKLFEEFGLHRSLSGSDINLIVSSWNFLKKRLISFAREVFIGYLKMRPDSKKMFPAFANVNIAELKTNIEFLSRAYNCIASLNYIIPHLKRSLPVQCPALKNLIKKDNHNHIDITSLEIIWLNAMQEELDEKIFTDDVRVVWKKVFSVLKRNRVVQQL